jgi:uncharacterized protein YndB with AHSA1/START domain
MDDPVEVSRSIELDLEPDEVWDLIGDGERWSEWMVDETDVDVVPGATGRVVDGREPREVRIDTVDDGERVAFTWWPMNRTDLPSEVDLHVVPGPGGTVLEVIERFPARQTVSASVAVDRWRWRAASLGGLRRPLLLAA